MPLTASQADDWRAGRRPDGAAFEPGERVELKAGEHAGAVARVVDLTELVPEPVYLVKTAGGEELLSRQSELRATS